MASLIDKLFPAGVLTAQTCGQADFSRLYPEEAACVARAGAKRRGEFASGRLLAREILSNSGISEFPLTIGADRAPKWPPGMIGSISHCDGLCGVAVARRGSFLAIGLDLEPATPLPQEVVERVCTGAEASWAGSCQPAGMPDWLKLFFSAKESVYKSLRGLVAQEFEFLDFEVEFQPTERRFRMHPSTPVLASAARKYRVEGRFAWTGDHLATGVSVIDRA